MKNRSILLVCLIILSILCLNNLSVNCEELEESSAEYDVVPLVAAGLVAARVAGPHLARAAIRYGPKIVKHGLNIASNFIPESEDELDEAVQEDLSSEDDLDEASVEDADDIEYAGGVARLAKGAVSLARRAAPYVSRLWKGADNAATAVNIADLAHGATQPSNGGNEAELDESESSEDELDEAIEDEDDIEYAGPGGLIRAARRAWPAIKNGAGKLAQLVNIGSAGAAVNEHATGNGGQQQESQLDEADNDYDDAVGDYDVARKSKHPRIAFVERRRSHHRTANKVTVNVNVNTHKCRRRK